MFGLYTPILLLQAFCIYHAYKNNIEQRWYWLIIFFPLVGCVIYLVNNFNPRTNVRTITEGVKEVVNSNYRVEQLEKALRFSNNFTNRMNLADAYVQYARYAEAVALYTECLDGFMSEDPVLQMKLLQATFLMNDYEAAIGWGDRLTGEKTFKNSEERSYYAWALHHTGKSDKAKAIFDDLDRSFTNYKQRLEYCRFLKDTGDNALLAEKLTELSDEIEHMKGPERRLMRDVIGKVRNMSAQQRA